MNVPNNPKGKTVMKTRESAPPYCGICKVQVPGHEFLHCPKAVCHGCKKLGHLKQVCPFVGKCYSCGMTGHVSRECPTKSNVQVTSRASEPVRETESSGVVKGMSYSRVVQAETSHGSGASAGAGSQVVQGGREGPVRNLKRPAPPVTVDANVKRMLFHMQKFCHQVDVQGHEEKLKDLDQEEKLLREEFESRMAKIQSARKKIIEEKEKARMIEGPLKKIWEGCQEMSASLGIGEEDISSDVEMAEVQIDKGSARSVESGEKQSSERPSGGAEKENSDEIRMECSDLESVKGNDKETEELDNLEAMGQVAVVQESEVKSESGGTDQVVVPRDRWFRMVERNELVTDQEAVTSREGGQEKADSNKFRRRKSF